MVAVVVVAVVVGRREVTTDVVVLRQYDCAYVGLRNCLGG